MKIVYLDQPSFLPQAMIDELAALGEFVVYDDRPDPEQIVARLADAEIAIVEWSRLPAEVLARCGRLRHIVLVTTGYDRVDVDAASSLGIGVSNTPGYSRQSVAEHVFALFLMLAKDLEAGVVTGRNPAASNLDHRLGEELWRASLGVVGVGSIGTWAAKIGLGFGMRVLGFNRSRILMPDVEQVDLDSLVTESSFIALCLPQDASTKGIISRRHFEAMSGQIMVTIGGNQCFDQRAAAAALRDGRLRGLGTDECPEDQELRQAPGVLITPGIAWYTRASLNRNIEMVVETVRSCVEGRQRFLVSKRAA